MRKSHRSINRALLLYRSTAYVSQRVRSDSGVLASDLFSGLEENSELLCRVSGSLSALSQTSRPSQDYCTQLEAQEVSFPYGQLSHRESPTELPLEFSWLKASPT